MKELNNNIRKLELEIKLLHSSKAALLRERRRKIISKEDYDFHKNLREDENKKEEYRQVIEEKLFVAKEQQRENRRQQKFRDEVKPVLTLASIIIMMLALTIMTNFEGMTGFTTFTKEETISVELNQTFVSDGILELEIANASSLSISGEIIGRGRAKVYLDINGTLFTVLDKTTLSSRSDNLITGMVIAEDFANISEASESIKENLDNITEKDNSSKENISSKTREEIIENLTIENENLSIEIEINETRENSSENISINIEINETETNISINESENISQELNITDLNITINESINISENISEIVNISDTNISLNISQETNTTIDENISIELNESEQNISINVTETENISLNESPIINISENISTNISEVINESSNVTLENISETFSFTDECVETCILDISSGKLIIELENTELRIDSIKYTKEIENIAPVQTKEIENISFYNEYRLNASEYFTEPEGEKIIYDIKHMPEIQTKIEEELINFATNKTDVYETFIYATDGTSLVKSNVFTLKTGTSENSTENTSKVIEENITQYRAVVGQPVKWRKTIKLEEPIDQAVIKIPKEASKIKVIDDEETKEITKERISVVENKTRKKLEQYETEKEIEKIGKQIEKEENRKEIIKLETQLEILEDKQDSLITGQVISELGSEGIITRFLQKLVDYFADAEITGRVIEEIPKAEIANNSKLVEEIEEDIIKNITNSEMLNISDKNKSLNVTIEEITINDSIIENEREENISLELNTTINTSEVNIRSNNSRNITEIENLNISLDNNITNITINYTENITDNISLNITIEEETIEKDEEKLLEENISIKVEEEIIENITNETITEVEEDPIIEPIDEIETNISEEELIDLVIEHNSTEITVEYETEAPIMIEEEINDYRKLVTISSEIHYTEILTYTNITPAPKENIGLYWIKNGTRIKFDNVSYIDTNSDGLIDMLEWIVPHLSNQTFEISITVLNIQSYPMVGGFWTVELNTTGTADLEIIPYNLTTFTKEAVPVLNNEDDLEFEEFLCGNESISEIWVSTPEECNNGTLAIDNSVECYIEDNRTFVNYSQLGNTSLSINITAMKIKDYNCSEISYWTDTVRTPGAHHILFTFGPDNASAHNWAVKNATSTTQNATVSIRRPSGAMTSIQGAYMLLNHTSENTETQHNTTWTYNYTKDCQEEGDYEVYVELMSLGNSIAEADTSGIDEVITYWVDGCLIDGSGRMNCTVHAKSKSTDASWKVFGGRLELNSVCNITSVAGDANAYWTADGQDSCTAPECGQYIEFYHNVSSSDQTDETTFTISCDDGDDDNTVIQLDLNETCGPSICGEATIASGGYDACANPTCTDNFTYIGNDTVESLGGFELMKYDVGILDTWGWSTVSTYNIGWDSEQSDCDCYMGTGNWAIGGDINTCCGDDISEFVTTRDIDETTMDNGYSDDESDDGCCNTWNDCMNNNTCYTYEDVSTDIDGDNDKDYCGADSTWYDCSSYNECGIGYYCSANDCVLGSINISFVRPTPDNNTKKAYRENYAYINTTIDSVIDNHSALIDWNKTLVGWWRMEQDLLDTSSYSNDGSCTNCPTNVTGKRGKAYEFDGVDDNINIGNSGFDGENYTQFTVSVWLKVNGDADQYDKILGVSHSSGITNDNSAWFFQQTQNSRTITGRLRTDTDNTGTITFTTPTAGEWNHYVFTWNSSDGNLSGYYNGVRISSTIVSGNYLNPTSYNLIIGKESEGSTVQVFNGSIDEVQIHRRVLTPEEINASYNSGTYRLERNFTDLTEGVTYSYTAYATDEAGTLTSTGEQFLTINTRPTIDAISLSSSSGENLTTDNLTVSLTSSDTDNDPITNITDWRLDGTSIAIVNMPFDTNISSTTANAIRDYSTFENNGTLGAGTVANAPTWRSNGSVGGAYEFDGSTDYIEIPDITFQSGDNWSISMWALQTGSKSYEFVLGDIDSGNRGFNLDDILGRVQYRDTNSVYHTWDTGVSYKNSWHHFTWTSVGNSSGNGTIELFIDGTSYGTVDTPTYTIINGIGRGYSTETWNYEGYLDEIQIFNYTLSAEQINASYLAGLAGHHTKELKSNETSEGDNWTVAITANDEYDDGITNISNNIDIYNSAPTINLVAPTNNTVLTQYDNRTPTFIWTASDPDLDSLNYTIWIYEDASLTNLNRSNYTVSTNFTPVVDLDVDTPYWWIVEVYDGDSRVNSTVWNFTIESYKAINLTTSTVDFGNVFMDASYDTENNASPMIIENIGNVYVNLSIYANTTLWLEVGLNTSYFQYKADISESGAFNTSLSTMIWANITSTDTSILRELDFHINTDEAEIDYNITVPSKEPPGAKNSQIIIIA